MNNIVGKSITTTYQIVDTDLASFKGQVIHQVCSTFALAREIEWSSRQFMQHICKEDEEGIGTMLTIDHKSPAVLNETLKITAKAEQFTINELICTYQVKVGKRIVATGKTGQKVLKKSKIEKIFSKLDLNE